MAHTGACNPLQLEQALNEALYSHASQSSKAEDPFRSFQVSAGHLLHRAVPTTCLYLPIWQAEQCTQVSRLHSRPFAQGTHPCASWFQACAV